MLSKYYVMKKRLLGRTQIEVSEIAFGGVEIGMPYGIGSESQNDMLSENNAIDLLHAAVDSGINFFDTARSYGNSEYIMGKAFKDRREKVVISTKSVHFRDAKGGIPDERSLVNIIQTSLYESLEALQTDYVDVFMLHTVDMKILENDNISRIFYDVKKSGKARAIGVSTYLPEETKVALEIGIWDLIQLPFNLMDQRQRTFFSLAAQKGVGIVTRSVLLKGLLSDRGKDLHPALKDVENHILSYKELLNGSAPDLATLAIKFALSFDEISTILVGIDRMIYLNKSIEAGNGDYLNKMDLLRAGDLSYPDPEFLNLHNWDKMGWLK